MKARQETKLSIQLIYSFQNYKYIRYKKMSEKNSRHYYKISSLSPPFIQNQMNRSEGKKSYSTNRIPNVSTFYNFIQELPQQYKESIDFKDLKNETISKKRTQSYNEIGGRQCKPFQNKIMLKKNEPNRHSNLLDKNEQQSDNQKMQEQNFQSKTKSNFVEQYRINLRRTVFNQTKLMIKNKKNKLKYDFYAVDDTIKLKQYSKQLDQNKIFLNKNSFHSHKIKYSSQKLSGADSMYKTIMKKQSNRGQIIYRQLDVARFPLLMRSKNQSNSNLNYSNLLMTLDMKQNDLRDGEKRQHFKKDKKNDRSSSRDSNFEKQEIKPWETFADQFMD